jgi:hypothetical protein
MKKVFITIVLSIFLIGCKKSDTELQIEHYELQKVKLEYLQALMKTKEGLSIEKRKEVIDSLIIEENTRLNNESN